jgi:proteasome alpha subunit
MKDIGEHQMMGYDRAITLFSPDGRLLQVEYAKKTVKQGSSAVGIVTKEGAVLITDKRILDKLVVPEAIEKIFKVDDHIGATASGIISDARVLIERAQLKAQQHKVTFDSPIDTSLIVKDVCSLMQICTQSGGLRPFGVSLLIIGIDENGPKLYETDPTGIYFRYKATAIGEGENAIEEVLHKEYSEDMSIEDAIKLGIKALMKAVDNDFGPERLDCGYITTKDKSFTIMKKEEIDKKFKEVKENLDKKK